MDAFATSVSIALQYGVPLSTLVDKFIHTRFEPAGFTKNAEIPIAKSIMDYIFRWLASKFLSREEKEAAGVVLRDGEGRPASEPGPAAGSDTPSASGSAKGAHVTFLYQQDAPSCQDCGSIMVRNGTCYKCVNCGASSGCG